MQGVRLVLSRPMKSGNLGACARLASNFEIDDCVAVAPLEGVSSASLEARDFATPAGRNHLEKFKIAEALSDALSDRQISIGFTRRDGRRRKPSMLLADVAQLSPNLKIALVFGNEKAGLSDDELALCTHTCFIPSGRDNPSLNLSHAVAVVLARVFEARRPSKVRPLKMSERASHSDFEDLLAHWRRFLGVESEAKHSERTLGKIRKILTRAKLSKSDAAFFHTLLRYRERTE
ncbi:MAG: RNA methyltransferase [Bdellovibrionia bacterium]